MANDRICETNNKKANNIHEENEILLWCVLFFCKKLLFNCMKILGPPWNPSFKMFLFFWGGGEEDEEEAIPVYSLTHTQQQKKPLDDILMFFPSFLPSSPATAKYFCPCASSPLLCPLPSPPP